MLSQVYKIKQAHQPLSSDIVFYIQSTLYLLNSTEILIYTKQGKYSIYSTIIKYYNRDNMGINYNVSSDDADLARLINILYENCDQFEVYRCNEVHYRGGWDIFDSKSKD